MSPFLRSVIVGLLILPGCGPADSDPPPERDVVPQVVSAPAPATDLEELKPPEVQERILLEELSRLAKMGPRAASRIDRVLWISRWAEATLEPARAALELIDPTGQLRVPALLQLEASGVGDSEFPGIVPDEEFKRLGAVALVPVLVPISRDPEDPQQENALWALMRVAPGKPGLLAELRQADMLYGILPEEGEDVLEMAKVWPELIAMLNSLLSSPDPDERMYTARKLKEATNLPRELLPALVDYLEDPDVKTRVYAALTLVRIAPDTEHLAVVLMDAFETGDRDLYEEAQLALRDLGPRSRAAAPSLARHVKHEDYIAVIEAAKALRHVDAPEVAIPALLKLMVEPLPNGDLPAYHHILNREMEAAAISLASYGDRFPGAVEFFVKYLPCNQRVSYRRGHEQRYIRGRDWAAEALGMLGPMAEEAVPALVAALEYGSGCSSDAARALVKIGDPGIDALVEALDHPQNSVRELAGSELSRLRLPKHEAALQRALGEKSVRVRAYACAALLRIEPGSQRYMAEAERLIENGTLGEDREWLRGVLEETR